MASRRSTRLSSSLDSSLSSVARGSRSTNATVGSTEIGQASRDERSFQHIILLPSSGWRGPWEYPLLRRELHFQVMCRYDRHQPANGRSSEEDVIGGIGIDYQIPDPYRLAAFLLTEGGVELDVALGSHPLARETDHVVVVRYHLGLGYSHGFKCFPVDDVSWASLIHKSFPDGKSVYIDWYHHGIVLPIVHSFKVVICEGDGWHPRSKCHRVHLVYCPKVLFSGAVCTHAIGEAAGYGVDKLEVSSSFDLSRWIIPTGRVVSSGSVIFSSIPIISSRGWLPSLSGLVFARGVSWI